jgi:hemerythrin-like domain-containing protein
MKNCEDQVRIKIEARSSLKTDHENARESVLERLRSCHRRIEERLAELTEATRSRQTGGAAIDRVEEVIGFADRSIARHEDDEEQSLFPRAKSVEAARPIIERLKNEHRAQNALWDRLRHAWHASARGEIESIARELAESYARHLEVEERELFPALETTLPAEAWTEIDREMEGRRDRGRGGGGGGGGGSRGKG